MDVFIFNDWGNIYGSIYNSNRTDLYHDVDTLNNIIGNLFIP
jgi:hypothetical protein